MEGGVPTLIMGCNFNAVQLLHTFGPAAAGGRRVMKAPSASLRKQHTSEPVCTSGVGTGSCCRGDALPLPPLLWLVSATVFTHPPQAVVDNPLSLL